MPATFTLLHASDLHFYRREHTIGLPDNLPAMVRGQLPLSGFTLLSSHDLALADALAAFAYVNRAGLDGILISGDLATSGEVVDLNIALEFVAAEAVPGDYHTADGFPTLRAAALPVGLLPGNHDRFGPSWKVFPGGGTAFDAVFGDYWSAGQGVQPLWNGQRDGARLVVLGADFSLAAGDDAGLKLYGHLGRGHVRQAVTDALLAATNQARADDPAAAVIWVIHFEPNADDSSLALYDPDNLLADATRAARPAAILCGHTHLVCMPKDFAEVAGLMHLCGTTTQWFAPHGNFFQIMEVEVDPADPASAAVRFRPFQFTQCDDGQSGFYEGGKCPGQ
jgi:3',5'-cyclic AMP phosphodiesterase CpdA